MVETLARLPARLLVGLIRLYQKTASPALSVAFGCGCGCRFVPSCSEYAAEALQAHGTLAGTWLAVRRLARCMPFSRGGFDPFPPAREGVSPRCVRIS